MDLDLTEKAKNTSGSTVLYYTSILLSRAAPSPRATFSGVQTALRKRTSDPAQMNNTAACLQGIVEVPSDRHDWYLSL